VVFLLHNFAFLRTKSSSSLYSSSNSPETLALEHINSGKPTTSAVLTNVLLKQNLSVSELKLKELLKVKGVDIDLPISTPENKKIYINLTGKSQYKGFFGVYIFTHKSTGQKYVGSSNLLRRRLDYYFKGGWSPAEVGGRFLPLLQANGLAAFKLQIFTLDSSKFSSKDALILEQYFLLNPEFNLNTLRVVNAGSSIGNGVFVYDLTCSTLYYHARSMIELKRELKIHPETSKKYIDSKNPYLNKFLLLSFHVPTAKSSHIYKQELIEIMQKERQKMYTLGTRRNIPVLLEIKKDNTFTKGPTKQYFASLTACIEYLKGLGLSIKRDTLSKYIKKAKEFQKFVCKYSEKTLPHNFENVGLIIAEYKKAKEGIDSIKVNKKNKPVIAVKENDKKEFQSITDTIKYFHSINIKLDRKILYLSIKDGKLYKGYYFSYK
jgi:hypothetical protein